MSINSCSTFCSFIFTWSPLCNWSTSLSFKWSINNLCFWSFEIKSSIDSRLNNFFLNFRIKIQWSGIHFDLNHHFQKINHHWVGELNFVQWRFTILIRNFYLKIHSFLASNNWFWKCWFSCFSNNINPINSIL